MKDNNDTPVCFFYKRGTDSPPPPPALLCYPVMDLLHPLSLFIDILSVKRYKEIKATTSLTEIEFLQTMTNLSDYYFKAYLIFQCIICHL